MRSRGSVHSWAGGEEAASEGPDLPLRCTGSSQQRKFLSVKPSLLKKVLFFAFAVTLLKQHKLNQKIFHMLPSTWKRLLRRCAAGAPSRCAACGTVPRPPHPGRAWRTAAAEHAAGGRAHACCSRRRREGQDRTMNSSGMKNHSMSEAVDEVCSRVS